MKPKELGSPFIENNHTFPLPSKAPTQYFLGISTTGNSRDASFPKKTNKKSHCSREISHT
jgi:hypothetical protein